MRGVQRRACVVAGWARTDAGVAAALEDFTLIEGVVRGLALGFIRRVHGCGKVWGEKARVRTDPGELEGVLGAGRRRRHWAGEQSSGSRNILRLLSHDGRSVLMR
jgi:hypothetical protein